MDQLDIISSSRGQFNLLTFQKHNQVYLKKKIFINIYFL